MRRGRSPGLRALLRLLAYRAQRVGQARVVRRGAEMAASCMARTNYEACYEAEAAQPRFLAAPCNTLAAPAASHSSPQDSHATAHTISSSLCPCAHPN